MIKKSFAMLVVPGLLVASLAYVAPAMAEDMNGAEQGMQQFALADNSSTGSGMGSGMGSSMAPSNDNSNSDAGSANSIDQGSPDTATGDDDY